MGVEEEGRVSRVVRWRSAVAWWALRVCVSSAMVCLGDFFRESQGA